jgi:hypothetical protein
MSKRKNNSQNNEKEKKIQKTTTYNLRSSKKGSLQDSYIYHNPNCLFKFFNIKKLWFLKLWEKKLINNFLIYLPLQ